MYERLKLSKYIYSIPNVPNILLAPKIRTFDTSFSRKIRCDVRSEQLD